MRKLIISGVNPDSSLREIFPQWNLYGVMDERNVILEKYSKTTFGNAQQSLQLVEALQCRDILLITSRLHMYRSIKTFQAIFPQSLRIFPHSVIPGQFKFDTPDLMIEATKSLFYSVWAY